MDDLVQFLRDRLAEDEQAARRAGSSFRQIGETGVIVATDGDRAEECASANWSGIAEHIVRHDPARVLREVEAKRRLLTDYVENAADLDTQHAPDMDYVGRADGLETALQHLATAYADHPDYRDNWRP
ncbi:MULTISPECIES: DUF6221 family protein [Streptomyces]|uniref:DUF6221 family protein n=1 Tax=Streptomyces TaxID=1883 RepID=UPI00131BCB35|nr:MULTISPECIES: DUF6221 family protein [Streptomyces]